jgi:hypothetical protein
MGISLDPRNSRKQGLSEHGGYLEWHVWFGKLVNMNTYFGGNLCSDTSICFFVWYDNHEPSWVWIGWCLWLGDVRQSFTWGNNDDSLVKCLTLNRNSSWISGFGENELYDNHELKNGIAFWWLEALNKMNKTLPLMNLNNIFVTLKLPSLEEQLAR